MLFLSIHEEYIIQKTQDINILIRLKNEYQSLNINLRLEILNMMLNSTDNSLFSSTFFKLRLVYYSDILKLSILNSLEEVIMKYFLQAI